jgi:hypothetical protein
MLWNNQDPQVPSSAIEAVGCRLVHCHDGIHVRLGNRLVGLFGDVKWTQTSGGPAIVLNSRTLGHPDGYLPLMHGHVPRKSVVREILESAERQRGSDKEPLRDYQAEALKEILETLDEVKKTDAKQVETAINGAELAAEEVRQWCRVLRESLGYPAVVATPGNPTVSSTGGS